MGGIWADLNSVPLETKLIKQPWLDFNYFDGDNHCGCLFLGLELSYATAAVAPRGRGHRPSEAATMALSGSPTVRLEVVCDERAASLITQFVVGFSQGADDGALCKTADS